MLDDDDLWALEERFWTQGADSAQHMTAKDAVFVFHLSDVSAVFANVAV